MHKKAKIAIIGGGAGGIVSAIAAAEQSRILELPTTVHIYESTDKIGRPILASGNGRCNFSNSHIDVSAYHNGEYAAKCLNNVDMLFNSRDNEGRYPNGVVAWLASHGLMYVEESEGRLYPRANKSSSVLDVLRLALEQFNVQVHLGAKVETIDMPRDGAAHMTIRMSDGTFERADKVIVACGGAAQVRLLPEGILSFKNTRPVLCPLEVEGSEKKTVRRLENIRIKCELAIIRNGNLVARENGEAMFRKYGISGICAFNLSRLSQKGDTLRMNLFPDMRSADLKTLLERRAHMFENAYGRMPTNYECMCGMLLPRVAETVIDIAALVFDAAFSSEAATKLAYALQHFDFTIEGPADTEHAQVQRGGFDVDGVNPKTMQVAQLPQVHIIGEALDIDGPCGGYNLNWAFATGLLAGRAAANGA